MKKIVTITLSPHLDLTLVTHYLATGYQNKAKEVRIDAGGYGFSISRALQKLGQETQAIILLGNDVTGLAYRALAIQNGVACHFISTNSPTQNNTIILDTGNESETMINTEMAIIDSLAMEKLKDTTIKILLPGDYLVCAGPIPDGTPEDFYADLIYSATQIGVKCAVVRAGDSLTKSLSANPDLVALTQIEAESYFNYPVRVIEDVYKCAEKLHQAGAVRVLIEMEEEANAMLITQDKNWYIRLNNDVRGTSSGVWDAFLAGFLTGQYQRGPIEESLGLGVSSAEYTASKIGKQFGSKTEVDKNRDEE